jgi:elongation factor G
VHLDVKGGNQHFDRFVEQVLREQLQRGPLGDFPVTDVAITVTADAQPDAWDDAVLADSIHRAFDAALHRADPYLLEPLVEITVRIPSDDVETVTRDIVRRRGEITERTDEPGGTTLLIARAPQSEFARYSIQLANVCDEAVLCDMHKAGLKALPKYLAARYLSAQFDSSNSRV